MSGPCLWVGKVRKRIKRLFTARKHQNLTKTPVPAKDDAAIPASEHGNRSERGIGPVETQSNDGNMHTSASHYISAASTDLESIPQVKSEGKYDEPRQLRQGEVGIRRFPYRISYANSASTHAPPAKIHLANRLVLELEEREDSSGSSDYSSEFDEIDEQSEFSDAGPLRRLL
ncbi:hypothetical protein IWZ00DRAFT_565089 [Phyllosticta capitalensis]